MSGAQVVDFGQLAAPPPPPAPLEEVRALHAAELEAVRAQAFAEGHAAGRSEAEALLGPASQALVEAAAQLRAAREDAAREAEHAAVALGLRIAEQATYAAVAVEPERVVAVVRGALRRLVERERVTLLVHPDDLEAVRGATDRLVGELGGIGHLEVQAERRLARGGAIVRTPDGDVDATLESKLDRAREVLEEALREEADGR